MPRKATKFMLTIPRFEETLIIELLFKNHLNLKKYVIAKELHHELEVEAIPYHVHTYFEIPNDGPEDLGELRETIVCGLQAIMADEAPTGFDLQQCKHPDNWIRYCTKVN
ncbi:MAG TPA: hypothetical protein VMR41_06000 [Patescibacteria group bacterium]|nr:hypothetical protein [Patescibacteria group bacterium]